MPGNRQPSRGVGVGHKRTLQEQEHARLDPPCRVARARLPCRAGAGNRCGRRLDRARAAARAGARAVCRRGRGRQPDRLRRRAGARRRCLPDPVAAHRAGGAQRRRPARDRPARAGARPGAAGAGGGRGRGGAAAHRRRCGALPRLRHGGGGGVGPRTGPRPHCDPPAAARRRGVGHHRAAAAPRRRAGAECGGDALAGRALPVDPARRRRAGWARLSDRPRTPARRPGGAALARGVGP